MRIAAIITEGLYKNKRLSEMVYLWAHGASARRFRPLFGRFSPFFGLPSGAAQCLHSFGNQAAFLGPVHSYGNRPGLCPGVEGRALVRGISSSAQAGNAAVSAALSFGTFTRLFQR